MAVSSLRAVLAVALRLDQFPCHGAQHEEPMKIDAAQGCIQCKACPGPDLQHRLLSCKPLLVYILCSGAGCLEVMRCIARSGPPDAVRQMCWGELYTWTSLR